MRNEPANAAEVAGEGHVFSIGHSHHACERFLQLLAEAGITAVVDVRSYPFSQRLPHFNQPELIEVLEAHDIRYEFLGDSLGGRPQLPSLYDADGRVDYERVRGTEFFRRGLERLVRSAAQFRVAMLCAEEDPLDCHRGLLITPVLLERRVAPLHVRGDGSIETTRAMEDRLLELTGLGGLFALTPEDRQQSLTEAYRAWSRKKAFRITADESDTE